MRPRDGPPSVPETPPPSVSCPAKTVIDCDSKDVGLIVPLSLTTSQLLPFPYGPDTFRSASLPPNGYFGGDPFVPVQFETPEDPGV